MLKQRHTTEVHWGRYANAIPMKGIAAMWVPLTILVAIIKSPDTLPAFGIALAFFLGSGGVEQF